VNNQFGDHIVDLFDKDIMATVTKNSQILNGNAALSDGFRVAHSYLAKSPACTARDIEEYNDCSNERNNNKNLPIPVCWKSGIAVAVIK
jgi:hypothetical protein